MKILVTGGAGFIASHLCDALLLRGDAVTVVDNLSLGKIENIEHNLPNKRFNFIELDLVNFNSLREIFRSNNFDMVFHLAANSDIQKGTSDLNEDYNNTFLSTFNILKCMREFEVKKLFFSSTSAIYGESISELNESYGPLLPKSNYGAAKLSSEAFISSFSSLFDMNVWIARFPNVVGSRLTHGVIFDFINKLNNDPKNLLILGNGKQVKPYLYVKDVVDGILFICENSKLKYNVFNLGSNTRTTVDEIALMVINHMNIIPEITYSGGARGWNGDIPEFRYNISKVNNLGWFARYSSNESVELTIKDILRK